MGTREPTLRNLAFEVTEHWLRIPRPVAASVSHGSRSRGVQLELTLDEGRVTLRRTADGQTAEWSEPLSAFEGLLLDGTAERVGGGSRGGSEIQERYWLDLVHPDPEKTIRLYQESHSALDDYRVYKHPDEWPALRHRWETYAQLLGVDALKKDEGRVVLCPLQDLGKPFGQLLIEGALPTGFDPDSEAPPGYAIQDEGAETVVDIPNAGQPFSVWSAYLAERFAWLLALACLGGVAYLLTLEVRGAEEEVLFITRVAPIGTGLLALFFCWMAWRSRRFWRPRAYPIRFRVSAEHISAMLITRRGKRRLWKLDTPALDGIEARAPLGRSSTFTFFPQRAQVRRAPRKRRLVFLAEWGDTKGLPHWFAAEEAEWLRSALLDALRRQWRG